MAITPGLIGLGFMGSNFARRVLAAGQPLMVRDVVTERAAALQQAGAKVAASTAELLAACEVVLMSLPNSEVAVTVLETELLPAARLGQVFVDLGTTRVHDTRRLAAALAEKGAHLLDAPVSGSPKEPVYMFVGGADAAFAQARPVLEIIASPAHLTHAGGSGAGQILKGVNQLAMGLVGAAWLETISFAVRQGVEAAVVQKAVGGGGGFRAVLAAEAQRIIDRRGEEQDCKQAELAYFLDAAQAAGIALPLTAALQAFTDGDKRWRDNMNRPYESFWHRLGEKA
jgi:3-hydroxyisobutyrate dehydrogenase-like beta-hydroxyacid dehydrogenase